MNFVYIIVFVINLFCFDGNTVNNSVYEAYPEPPKTDKLLFFVQRSHNKNTIVYDLNISPDGKLDIKNPVHPYWMRFEEGGKIMELSFIQRKYAYGIDAKLVDPINQSFIINFVSYHKRNIYLFRINKNERYKAYINSNGKLIILNKIFFKYEGGPFWFPVIRYIDIVGSDIKTGEEVKERFIP